MKRRYMQLLLVALLLLPALACGGGDEATPTPESAPETAPTTAVEPTQASETSNSIEIREATFARGLSEEMQAVDPTTDFGPTDTVYLSLTVKGRPKEGTVAARFYWGDDFIAEADVDLGDVNSGLIFSIGEDTFVGYTLTHEQPFPVSDGYRAEVFYNDQALGSYSFRVVPPPEAIPTQINEVVLARGADENYNPVDPSTSFAPADTVYLVGHGDLGIATWLQADWYVNGQLDEAGTRSLGLEENYPDVGFSFSFLPEGGWPAGEHYVTLTVNGEEIGRYTFTIAE